MASTRMKMGAGISPKRLGLLLILSLLIISCLLSSWQAMKLELVLPIFAAYLFSAAWSRGASEVGIGVCLVISGLQPLGSPRVTGVLAVLLIAVHLVTKTSEGSLGQLRIQRVLASLFSVLAAAHLGTSIPHKYIPILLYVVLGLSLTWFSNMDGQLKSEYARSGVTDALWILSLGLAAEVGNISFVITILLWLTHGALLRREGDEKLTESFTTQMGVAEQTLRDSEKRRLKERELIKNLASLQAILDRFQGEALKSQGMEELGICLLGSIDNLKRGVAAGLVRARSTSGGFLSSTGSPELKRFLPLPESPVVRQTLRSPDGQRLLCPLSTEVYLCLDLGACQSDELTREIVQNLLERTYLVSEILQQQHQLAKLVSEKSQALESLARSQEQLVQSGKMAAVGQLAAGVAHEINSPLAAIHVQTQLATRRLNKGDLEGVGRSLETSLSASTRAKTIIDNLLTFSRLSDGSKRKVSLAEAVRLSLAMVEAHPGSSEVEIVSEVSESLVVEANLQDLQHIITNICLNAIDALLESTQSPRVLTLETSLVDQLVRLDLKNNGPPIPEDIVGKLFEPFFTTKDVGKGTGLGLSIAYELSENLGAKLSLVSEDGWVCFRLEFPIVD